ncbi:MAG: hypothetical protein ACYCYP_12495 [Leptospirales bacterium]
MVHDQDGTILLLDESPETGEGLESDVGVEICRRSSSRLIRLPPDRARDIATL